MFKFDDEFAADGGERHSGRDHPHVSTTRECKDAIPLRTVSKVTDAIIFLTQKDVAAELFQKPLLLELL